MTRSFRTTRRTFLANTLLAAGAGTLGPGVWAGSGQGNVWLSAASDADDQHWVRAFTLQHNQAVPLFSHSLPARAHHVAVSPASGLYVVVARRPGKWLMLGDIHSGELLAKIDIPESHSVMGHGVFDRDGRRFYSVECDNTDKGDNGRIGVWQLEAGSASFGLTRIGEFPTHGTGPHELKLMPDNSTLVVANGGIRTHPDSEREILNLDSMDPSLIYIDSDSGHLLEQHRMAPEYHQNSIRHLDVNAQGQVALVMQYEGEPFHDVPLVALHRRGEPLRLPELPTPVQQQMKQYCGSVRFDASGRYLAVSCPRGNMMTFWDAQQATFMAQVRSRDGCGVCATENGFLFTSGSGRIAHYDPLSGEATDYLSETPDRILWDNHLSMLSRS